MHVGANSVKERDHAVAQLVEEPRYKPEDRGFDSRCCHWNFSLTYSLQTYHQKEPSLFWDIKRRRLVVSYRRFGSPRIKTHTQSCAISNFLNEDTTNFQDVWQQDSIRRSLLYTPSRKCLSQRADLYQRYYWYERNTPQLWLYFRH
jgi:hypothetical protein